MQRWGVIYKYKTHKSFQGSSLKRRNLFRLSALGLIALSLGGITGPLTPALRLEASYVKERFAAEA